MASLARSATQNVPQSSACKRQQRAVPAAAAVRPQWRPSQQQRWRSLVVRAQELEEIDPITGEVIAGTAMATEAGQRVEAGEQFWGEESVLHWRGWVGATASSIRLIPLALYC